MRRFLLICAGVASLVVLGLAGCARGPRQCAVCDGFVQVPGGRVWYHMVRGGPKTPLLVLHAGPGGSSIYLRTLEALADERTVVFYDQLGGGRSDRPADSTLWTLDRFVAELAQVRVALGLREVHIFGHSFGSMIAADYMLTRHPAGVRSLILAGPVMSIARWTHDLDSLRSTLPDSVQKVMERNERAGTTGSPEYLAAMMVFYHRYMERRDPWTPQTDTLFAQANEQISRYMEGPDEFKFTGTLKDYDRTADLVKLGVPTLYLGGEFDVATPGAVEWYHELTPNSEMLVIPGAAHLMTQDKPEDTVTGVRAFLHKHDGT
jgi:proline iminopeptidase